MPINPSALSSPEPEPEARPATSEEAVVQPDAEQPQRRRRTKAELIAAAVVPADDAMIEVKDAGTGAKVQRPWPEAVTLVKAEQAEFVDKSLKYAMLKADQQPVAESSAFAQPAAPSENPADREVRYTVDGQALLKTGQSTNPQGVLIVSWSDDNGGSGLMTNDEWELLSMSPPPSGGGVAPSSVPPDAELGDEVRVGAETLRIGHGGVLTNSPVAVDGEVVKPKRRWQRALGMGVNGPWESTVLNTETEGRFVEADERKVVYERDVATGNVGSLNRRNSEDPAHASVDAQAIAKAIAFEQKIARNGSGGEANAQSERLPVKIERLDEVTWKITTGILEKIGLPQLEQYAGGSQLQVGPISITRYAVDDGRRSVVSLNGGREGSVPTSIVEAFEEGNNTVEFVASRFRGQLQSFLEAIGAIRQPVA